MVFKYEFFGNVLSRRNNHRALKKDELEYKAKVVASVWGTKSLPR